MRTLLPASGPKRGRVSRPFPATAPSLLGSSGSSLPDLGRMRPGRIVHSANSRISVLFVLELPLALVLPLYLNDRMPRLQAKALPFVRILRKTHTPITIAISELTLLAPLPPGLSHFRAQVPSGEGHLPGNYARAKLCG